MYLHEIHNHIALEIVQKYFIIPVFSAFILLFSDTPLIRTTERDVGRYVNVTVVTQYIWVQHTLQTSKNPESV